jgi:hypothetical protein
MVFDRDLTFLPQLLPHHDLGAVWNCIVWPVAQTPQAFCVWMPKWWFTFDAGLATSDKFAAAGWEQAGTWPPTGGNDTTVVRLWSQLADVRNVKDSMRTPEEETFQSWARPADIAHAKAAPVMLAWRAPKGATGLLEVKELFPPPQFGEVGFVEAHEGAGAVEVLEAKTLGGEVLATQQKLSAALRAIATPESRQLAQRSLVRNPLEWPEWLTRWEEVRTVAKQLAAAYWHEAMRRKGADIPYVFDDEGMTRIPSLMPIHAILSSYSGAQAGKRTGWLSDPEGRPSYQHKTKEHVTTMQIRATEPNTYLDEVRRQQLWQQVDVLDDLDGDVFLAMLAQFMANPDDPAGVWITVDQILDYRGIQPIMKRDEHGVERRAGHRQEDRLEIGRRVERKASQWVLINSVIVDEVEGRTNKKGTTPRKKRYTHESKQIQIEEVISQEDLFPDPEQPARAGKMPIRWRYRMGTWLTDRLLSGPNRPLAWLCQQALKYDPHHEKWEKRLSRYFVFHLRINLNKGGIPLKRSIEKLLADLSLTNELDDRNPERSRQRFEKALDRLVTDGVIDGWEYAADNATLPARHWLTTWRTWSVLVHASQAVVLRSPPSESAQLRRELPPVAKARARAPRGKRRSESAPNG